MSLRKINSIIALVCIILIIIHMFLTVFYMFGFIPYSLILEISGIIVFYVFLIHAVISLYQFRNNKSNVERTYPKIRKESEIQAINGILVTIFIFIHFIMHFLSVKGYPIVIVDVILFILLGNHFRLSIPRLLVSMGFLTSEDSYDFVDKIVRVLVLICMILAIISEVVFYIL